MDDEPAIRRLLSDVLSAPGHGVFTVRGGHFDLIITDVNMPGMDGTGLLRRMKKHRKAFRITSFMKTMDAALVNRRVRSGWTSQEKRKATA